MNLRRPLLFSLFLLGLPGLPARRAHAGPLVQQAQAAAVLRFRLDLDARTYQVDAVAASPGVDPVIHLFDESGNQVAMADDNLAAGIVNPDVLFDAHLRYTVPTPGIYTLVVRPNAGSAAGMIHFTFDGFTFPDLPLSAGAPTVPVPRDRVYRAESGGVVGGGRDTQMLALDCRGRVVGFDDDGGVGVFSRLNLPASACSIAVTNSDGRAERQNTRVYFNDVLSGATADMDGDGLGAALEADLGTCDSATTHPYCRTVFNHRDSDRDGLPDPYEIFGKDDFFLALPLPLWGADPRHKDIFIEAQVINTLPSPFYPTEEQIVALQAAYNDGRADELHNPDGRPGVSLHVDTSYNPTNPANRGLLGRMRPAWSDGVFMPDGTPDQYKRLRPLDVARSGVFTVFAGVPGNGGGQRDPGSSNFTGGVTGSGSAETIAHELGHGLGLMHGALNDAAGSCPPVYQSLMNYFYAYPSSGVFRFSHGGNAPRNPMSVDERVPIAGDVALFRDKIGASAADFFPGDLFDWNGNGRIDATPVRAAVTMAPTSCAATAQQADRLEVQPRVAIGRLFPPLGATSQVVKLGGRMYTFYLLNDRIVWQSSAVGTSLRNGSCPLGNRPNTRCANWDRRGELPFSTVSTFAFAIDGSELTVIYRSGGALSSQLYEARAPLTASGALGTFAAPRLVLEAGAWATSDIELTRIKDSARLSGERLALLYTFLLPDNTYELRWATREGTTWSLRGAVTDAATGTPLRSAAVTMTPGLYNWRSGDTLATCGLFGGAAATYRCYDQASGGFRDLTPAAGLDFTVPTSKPGIAFVPFRDINGRVIDPAVGRVMLAAREATAMDGVTNGTAKLFISRPISPAQPPTGGSAFTWKGETVNQWARLAQGANISLLSDPQLGAVKASTVYDFGPNGIQELMLEFYGQFDGIFDATMRDQNDFHVMERSVCLQTRIRIGDGPAFCGPANEWGY